MDLRLSKLVGADQKISPFNYLLFEGTRFLFSSEMTVKLERTQVATSQCH